MQRRGEKVRGILTSKEIKEMYEMWGTVENFVEKHHWIKDLAVHIMNWLNNSAVSHFCEILKDRQK